MRTLPLLLLLAAPQDDGWTAVRVPGGEPGWYRAWVKPHDSFFARHERNLFEESVGVHVRGLPGKHALWVNGTKLGDGEGEGLHRHKVPPGTLKKGEWNEIALHAQGALREAPFIMNYFMECVLEGDWEHRGGAYAPGGPRKERPSTAAYDRFHESNRVLGRAEPVHGPKLAPSETAGKMQPAREFAVDLLLHEPLVAQPFHFSFDARGRLWIAQCRQYPYPAGLSMISRDKYYRAHYDKVPPPPPDHDRGADVISIHAPGADGTYVKHAVFADGLNLANAVVTGAGGVWVMNPPYLLFYPDTDGDDRPDGPPEVRLAGFGLEDTHASANGLAWGPDGWLYGAQGSTVSCRVVRPGVDPPEKAVAFEGCLVWRYHPRTRAFEVFSEGGGNTFGLEFDAEGRLHSGHNGGDTRGWHFVQGGYYRMQGADPGKYGPPRNPYAFGELPSLRTDDRIVRFTHFGVFGDGTALPSKHDGLLFALDPLHNVVTRSARRPRGSTFETSDLEPALRCADPAFRPVYAANAPDGSILIADMYEFYIAHGQHYQNQIDPTTGRIWRLRGKDARLETDVDLESKPSEQLVALLDHPNKWHRMTAVRLLGERRAAHDPLKAAVASDDGRLALHALWALYQGRGFDAAAALAGLAHAHPPVRLWTVRLLGDEFGRQRGMGLGRHAEDRSRLPRDLFEAVSAAAAKDPNLEVLAQIASTARRLEADQALALAAALLARDEAADDLHVPHLVWWIFEAHLPAATEPMLALLDLPGFWDRKMVREHLLPRLARRYAVEGRRQDLLVCAELFGKAPTAGHAKTLLAGFEEAYRGRPMTGLPEELLATLGRAGELPLIFRLKLGETAAVEEAVRRFGDAKAKAEDRALYARALGERRAPEAVAPLLAAAGPGPDELRKAALGALSAYDDDAIGDRVAAMLPSLDGEVRTSAFGLLASRARWSGRLLDAVEGGRLKRAAVPDDVATRLRGSEDAGVRSRAERLLPSSPPDAGAFRERMAAVEKALQAGAGNPYAGEATFMARCANCHTLFHKGGKVGPDLTTYQRDNLGTMLLSIVNPSAEIREGFQYYLVATTDERVLSGFFVDRDTQVVVLRMLDGETVSLRTSQIRAIKPTGQSLMPPGLLDGLSDEQLRDFFAYLRIKQPISK